MLAASCYSLVDVLLGAAYDLIRLWKLMPRIDQYRFTDQSDEVRASRLRLADNRLANSLAGDDLIKATASGLSNAGRLRLADGDDRLIGLVDDALEGRAYGLANTKSRRSGEAGEIKTGEGDDLVRGSARAGADQRAGIFNQGLIDTQAGDDTVDALIGGFAGQGVTRLGLGDDALIGFGRGFFDAGGGFDLTSQSDRILLPEGVYSISTTFDENGYFVLSKDGVDMLIQGFEFIGSASAPGALSEFLLSESADNSNSITVDSTGVLIAALDG